jgi:hypothetical protein
MPNVELACVVSCCCSSVACTIDFVDRSLIVKKSDGIKESTDSCVTVEEDDQRGRLICC